MREVKRGSEVLHSEKNSLSINAVIRTPGFGRLEISGPFGVNVGTVTWTRQEVKVLIPQQKKVIISDNDEFAFYSLIKILMAPHWMEAILNRYKFSPKDLDVFKKHGIHCQMLSPSAGRPAAEECASENFVLRRKYPTETEVELEAELLRPAPNVAIEKTMLNISFSIASSKVEERAALWVLETPSGFQSVKSAHPF